tara:strand:+ start:127 stop:498 length:372 start_codon:yes stop_codon:yes gene_type:complete
MTETQQKIAADLETELAIGTLTTARLRQGIADIVQSSGNSRQDLLYLQAANTSPHSQVVGMMLIQEGVRSEGGLDAEKWPYQTVLDAVREGWRIISFPNMALLAMDHDDSHGLGFEFILEKWS